MDNYQPNSHRFREEAKNANVIREKQQKIVKNPVKIRQNELKKLSDVFISEDISNVKSYLVIDVLVPAVKKLISDIITDGTDMLLFGNNGRRSAKSSSGFKISYGSFFNGGRDQRQTDTRPKNRFDHEDIVYDSRAEAEAVRTQMNEVIERYGFVTVADMYDIAGSTAPYTSDKYGWMNIRTAEVIRLRDGGYILKLPKASAID